MPISLAPTFRPLPLVRKATLTGNTIHNAFSSYSPSCSPFSNRSNVRLRNRRNPPLFGTLIKCAAGGAVLEIDETQFNDVVLKSERPVLVEFVATWCGPCRLIAPAVQLLAKVTSTSRFCSLNWLLRNWCICTCYFHFPQCLILR